MDCLFCGHGREDHQPDSSSTSHKAHQHRVRNLTPAHCENNPTCSCVMFASTEAQASYCRLPTYERWVAVAHEARALGLDLAPIRPAR